MAFVQTFSGVLAPIRADNQPWTSIYIEEAAASSGPWTLISTQAWTDLDPATAEPTSITVTTAALEEGWYRMHWSDASAALSPSTPPVHSSATSTQGWILTLSELRNLLGVDPTDTRNDALYTTLIPAASAAVRAYTQRDFGLPVETGERSFLYDGSGFLDVDDASAITSVVFAYPYGSPDITLDPETWSAKDSPAYTYVEIPSDLGRLGPLDPEMGFTWNADVYARERGGGLYPTPKTVKVTGTWGWAVVPDDVKVATAWVVQAWETRPTSDNMTAEAIEGWSRAWGTRNSSVQLAIPEPVRDLLANYSRVSV